MDYSKLSDEELLEMLEQAGRTPVKALLTACLARRSSLTPHLLKRLLADNDPDWEDDDPRWFRAVHFGRLLIAFREPAAIPLFMEILREDEWETLAEWFQTDLHHYGPAILPPLFELLADEDISPINRTNVVEILCAIADRFPEARRPVRDALAALLPALKEDGTLDIEDPDDFSDGEIGFLTFVAMGLGRLGDRQSLPVVEALHQAGLIDEMVYGDFAEYQKEYFSPKGFRYRRRTEAYDLLRAYDYTD